jgi:AraC-like DNA-binding protein
MDPLAHTAGLRQFVRFARAEGVALSPGFAAELIAALEDGGGPDYVPAIHMIDGLQLCAETSGRSDLGAAFGVWADITDYGPLSRLTGHCASVHDAIENGMRYMHLANGALTTVIEADERDVALRRICVVAGRRGCSQFMENVLMVAVRAMRVIRGERWSPRRVEFAHAAPQDLRAHNRLFRCTLRFGADRYAVVIPRADFYRTAPVGDVAVRAAVDANLKAMDRVADQAFADTAHREVARALALGSPRLDVVAAALACSPRSLQRQLAEAGLSFAGVLDAVRRNIAADYLAGAPQPSLTILAQRLGYSDASAASRFLRQKLSVRLYPRPSGPPLAVA